MHCPVCPNPNIPPDHTSCANCGADVTSIRRLQELPARWYNEALALLRNGETARAIAKLHSALELDPESVPIRNLLAKAQPRRNLRVAGIAILALVAFGAGMMMTKNGERASRPQRSGILPERPQAKPPGETPAGERARRPPSMGHLESRRDIRVERDDDGIHITFLEGLFPSGSDVPTPDGRVRLESLARDLGAVRVEVEGFTDSNPPPRERWKDNWSLAFSRAHATVQLMRAAGAEGASWRASSSGDRDTPYPQEGNQSKNRTVVLHVADERRNP